MRPVSRPLVLLPLALALSACAGLPHLGGSPAPDPQAESLFRSGDYEGAMRRYQYLAQTSRDSDYYLLLAAEAALRAKDGAAAQRLSNLVNPRELPTVDQHQHLLLQSRLDLNAGRARAAMTKLDKLEGVQLTSGQELNYHTLRASAYNQLGDMLASAKERVALGPMLGQSDAVQRNNEAIYDALSRLPDSVLAQKQASWPDVLGGWIALTRILNYMQPSGRSAALDEWRSRYPGHPATGEFLDKRAGELGLKVRVAPLEPTPRGALSSLPPTPETPAAPAEAPPPTGPFVGVLLPLSGAYAPAAEAIRAGMIAAHYADPNPAKLPLRFVDSEAEDIKQAYRKLVDQGAQAVVGPLIKDQVASLAKSVELPVPVLGLNQVADASNDRLYQLGLSPEQEVEQAASSAWFDGKQNALVLAPSTTFGQRILGHFTRYWRTLGGRIGTSKKYTQHAQDFSAPVKELLAATTPPAAPNPADPAAAPPSADFVFLVADARDARSILPQIAAHPHGAVPVYAISHVHSGKPDPQADQDLNGLIFCDVPWLLEPEQGGALSAQALQAQIDKTPPDYVKLIALGLDAYRLLPELDRLKFDPQYHYPGATGTLSLQIGNRLQRQLECAQFQEGKPQPRGIAPVLQPGAPSAPASP
jgi:outer membrane PBP1 activator LpoA protein